MWSDICPFRIALSSICINSPTRKLRRWLGIPKNKQSEPANCSDVATWDDYYPKNAWNQCVWLAYDITTSINQNNWWIHLPFKALNILLFLEVPVQKTSDAKTLRDHKALDMRQFFGQLLVARLEALAMAAPGGETVHQDVLARFLARRHGRWTLNLQGTGLAYTFRPGKLQGEDP